MNKTKIIGTTMIGVASTAFVLTSHALIALAMACGLAPLVWVLIDLTSAIRLLLKKRENR